MEDDVMKKELHVSRWREPYMMNRDIDRSSFFICTISQLNALKVLIQADLLKFCIGIIGIIWYNRMYETQGGIEYEIYKHEG